MSAPSHQGPAPVAWPQPWASRSSRRPAGRARSGGRLRAWWPGTPQLPDLAVVLDRLPAILAGLDRGIQAGASSWHLERAAWTSTSTVVAVVGHHGSPQAVVKLPQGPAAEQAVRQEVRALQALRALDPSPASAGLLPEVLGSGKLDGQVYAVYRHLRGEAPLAVLHERDRIEHLLDAVAAAMAEIHRGTASPTTVDAARLESWVAEPAALVERLLRRRMPGARHRRALRRLTAELSGTLSGRDVVTCWAHGDLWLGNVLVDEAGDRLTGIVDWDKATPDGLADLDGLHLVLFTRSLREHKHLGSIITEMLSGRDLSAHERSLFERLQVGDLGLPRRALVLLYWLRHTALEIEEKGFCDQPYYQRPGSLLWELRNVDRVLAVF